MTDDKQLLKGDNLNVSLKVDAGRIKVGASSLEGSFLTLRDGEYLEVRLIGGSVVVIRKAAPTPIHLTADVGAPAGGGFGG